MISIARPTLTIDHYSFFSPVAPCRHIVYSIIHSTSTVDPVGPRGHIVYTITHIMRTGFRVKKPLNGPFWPYSCTRITPVRYPAFTFLVIPNKILWAGRIGLLVQFLSVGIYCKLIPD